MNLGFVSTRFAGTDGVSLESLKWAEVLERAGHRCFWFAGLCDHPPEVSRVVPPAHFAHPAIEAIAEQVWGREDLPEGVAVEVEQLRSTLRDELAAFARQFQLDLLVVENAVTIPMNLPLGLAITDFLRDSGMPALAHHHDFHWERERFSGAAARPWLEEAFPPRLPRLAHAVIHSAARREMIRRFGVEAVLVPNVMDFDRPPPPFEARAVREKLGLAPGDRLILQPTRVVPRKGIEHAIDLLHQLGDPRHRLLVSHEAGDEGLAYRDGLLDRAGRLSVSLSFLEPGDPGTPSLGELYGAADFVTFPSLYEGFGNALLEAVFYRKPVLVNRYPVFREDIEPLGFDFVVMDGTLDDSAVTRVREILERPGSFAATAGRNFQIAARSFGYPRLTEALGGLIRCLGIEGLRD